MLSSSTPLKLPLHLHQRSPAERETSLSQTLAQRPGAPTSPIHLFVYGILAKNPPFTPAQTYPLELPDYHRSFNLADPLNRGTPYAPGLTLGLEPGSTCKGLVLVISPEDIRPALTKVWQQEMLLPFYLPTWLTHQGQEYLTMLTDPHSPALRPNLSQAHITATISYAMGNAGSNLQYLEDILTVYTAWHSPPIL